MTRSNVFSGSDNERRFNVKIEWNKKYTTIAVYACAVMAITVLFVFLGINIKSVGDYLNGFIKLLNPLIIGFIIAYLLNPLMQSCEHGLARVTDRKKPHPLIRRILALITTYIVYTVIIALIMALVIPQVAASYNDLMGKMTYYTSSLESFIKKLTIAFPFIDMDKLLTYLNGWVSNSYTLIQNVTPYITGFFAALVDQLKNAFFGIVISVYFLFSKEKLAAQSKKLMYAFLPQKSGDSVISFLNFTDDTFGGFIIGKLLDSLIIGVLTFIVLALLDMPYYQLISVIIGVTNIIPFFGPFIGAIPSAFIIFIADPLKALWFIIVIIVIQQIDGNIIGPKILGETTGLSSLGVIVAITVMSGLLGVAGMFIGVPLFALLYIGFKRLLNHRIEKLNAAAAGVSDNMTDEKDDNGRDDGRQDETLKSGGKPE
jgi:predicted PurR-regulated permease PerM